MKTLKEQIEVMQHYLNSGEVEILCDNGEWNIISHPTWNWFKNKYRIKEEKQTIIIEKYHLCTNNRGRIQSRNKRY